MEVGKAILLSAVITMSVAVLWKPELLNGDHVKQMLNECDPANPCNEVKDIEACPPSWMGHAFHDSYVRHVGNAQNVCDYEGSVTQKQCDAEGALSTAGPHGEWCQKFINNNAILLSLARVSGSKAMPPLVRRALP